MENLTINIWAILAAGLVAFGIGGIWFMPKVFGQSWMDALGKSEEELGSPTKALVITFLTTMLSAFILALIIEAFTVHLIVETTWDGIWVSAMVAIGIYATSAYSDFLFCVWPRKVILIQMAYHIVKFMSMGAILATWT